MTTHDIVDAWRREAIEEGEKKGEKKGREGGAASSLIDLFEARFGAMPEDVRRVVEGTHDEITLRGWVKLAGTHGVEEIVAAIRAHRTR